MTDETLLFLIIMTGIFLRLSTVSIQIYSRSHTIELSNKEVFIKEIVAFGIILKQHQEKLINHQPNVNNYANLVKHKALGKRGKQNGICSLYLTKKIK